MASTLTFTSDAFMQGLTASLANSATNTKYDILSVDATYSRRIYGISISTTDGSPQTVRIYLHDGSQSFQVFMINVPANSGNLVTTSSVDVMGSVYGASVFNKQRDANGVPYFNIPAGWKVQYDYNTALLASEGIFVLVFGETYA